MKKIHQTALRLAAYWFLIFAGLWTITYYFATAGDRGWEWFAKAGVKFVGPTARDVDNSWIAGYMFGMLGPLLVASSFAYLAITDIPLPVYVTSYFNKAFNKCRKFPDTWKKNQFGVGDINFDYLSILIIILPLTFYLVYGTSLIPQNEYYLAVPLDERKQTKVAWISDWFAWVGTLAMSFFLIPVSRHSVLLCAMGWSPVHALRLHIWAGYFAAFLILLHGVMFLGYWIAFEEEALWRVIIPESECWYWTSDEPLTDPCYEKFWNITGVVAGIFFFILVASSINWVRRRHYRLFYIFHVIFGTLTMLASMLHYSGFALYVAPGIVYYLAATTPVLVQAAASFFKGGVEIVKVSPIEDSGGCSEIELALTQKASLAMDREPCMFVKLCVPKISLVWHPFTVYKHPQDPRSVRIMFRPVGPFTNKLSEVLKVSPRPPIVIDGFYTGGDRAEKALEHDQVTIVTGGVGITPFLSLILHVFQKLTLSPEARKTIKGVTLHWVCREEGLIKFVKANYLDDLQERAARIGQHTEFTFNLHIYHTAAGGYQESDGTEEVFKAVASATAPDGSTSGSDSDNQENTSTPSESNDAEDAVQECHEMEQPIDGSGHSMREARFKAGLFPTIRHNVPAFLLFSFVAWFGLMIIWRIEEHLYAGDFKVHNVLVRMFGTLASLLVSIVSAFLVEGVAQLVDKKWKNAGNEPGWTDGTPAWTAGTEVFASVMMEEGDAPVKDDLVEEGSDDSSDTSLKKAVVSAGTLSHHSGRPTPEVLLDEASKATCPGIFMCGPTALTDGVTLEAKKENSLFGRTRYALYAEPFEM